VSRILGAVLAGGESRRFGSDKAVAILNGQSLIERVIDHLASQVDEVIVCGRSDPRYVSVRDRPAPHLGPLGGLNAALHHAQACGFCLVLTAPCDTPDLPADLAERLSEAGEPAYLSNSPVIGLWPAALANTLDAHLAATKDRSIRLWAAMTGAQPIDLGTVVNINTLSDLRSIETRNGLNGGKVNTG
jgi:molybdopterin-guanine dinucleotide biosynthesis protein A